MQATLPIDEALRTLIHLAVREDLGGLPGEPGAVDRTVDLAIPTTLRGTATIVARRPGVVAGGFLLEPILQEYMQTGAECAAHIADGQAVDAGEKIATLRGPLGRLLTAERVLLNFLSRLSGVATLTRQFVEVAARAGNHQRPVICDTRKTTPGWRVLEKYAVRCGGGVNHRMGLYDGVMLKDNHLATLAQGSASAETLAALTARLRRELPAAVTLWLEVDTLAQLTAALPGGGADIILLDNMSVGDMTAAVALRDRLGHAGRPLLEASGGITLENLAAVAATGVDRVSIGALTHHAVGLDLSMEFA